MISRSIRLLPMPASPESSTTCPSPTSAWSRAARLGVAPVTAPRSEAEPPEMSLITTGPVAMPTRAASGCAADSIAATASTAASPARIARSAESSRARGHPKYARTPSPSSFVTWPSLTLTAVATLSWYLLMSVRSSSGSSLCESSVELARSQNITVSWRRSALRSGPPADATFFAPSGSGEPSAKAARSLRRWPSDRPSSFRSSSVR